MPKAVGQWTCGQGLSHIKGAKGTLHLEAAIHDHLIKYGKDVLHEILADHPIVSVDPGQLNEISATAIVGKLGEDGKVKAHWFNKILKTKRRINASGIDYVIKERKKERDRKKINKLKNSNMRTLDEEEFDKGSATFTEVGGELLEANYHEANLRRNAHKSNRSRSYMASVPNTFLAMVDALVEYKGICEAGQQIGAPIIVFGRPTFKPYGAAPKKMIEYLKRFFTVVTIDEFNTSKLCAHCSMPLTHWSKAKGYRMWICEHGCMKQPRSGGPKGTDEHSKTKGKDSVSKGRAKTKGKEPVEEQPKGKGPRKRRPLNEYEKERRLIVNKDKSATLNIFKVFCWLMGTGNRPPQYRRQQH